MKIAICHPDNRSGPARNRELAAYDRVVQLKSFPLDHPDVICVEEGLSIGTISEMQRVDGWATRLRNRLRLDDRAPAAAEAEAYRNWMLDVITENWLVKWDRLTASLSGMLTENDRVTLCSDKPLLRAVLELWLSRRGAALEPAPVPARSLKKFLAARPELRWLLNVAAFRHEIRAAVANRKARAIRTRNQAAREEQARVVQRLRDEARAQDRPVALFYLQWNVCFQILEDAMARARETGFFPVAVDVNSRQDIIRAADIRHPIVRLHDVVEERAIRLPRVPAIRFAADRNAADDPELVDALANSLTELLTRDGGPVIEWLTEIHRLFWNALPPVVVLMAENGVSGACLALAAARAGLPMISVAHAVHLSYAREYGATAIALFGEDNVRHFRACEEPPASCRLIGVGPCRYDRMARKAFQPAGEIRHQLRIPDGGAIVCYASTWIADHMKDDRPRDLDWIIRALPEQAVLVVKKHPMEHDDFCERMLSGRLVPARFRVVKEIDLYGLLAASRVVVTINSSMGAEAVVLGSPLVINISNPDSPWMSYVVYGVAVPVASPEEMQRALREAMLRGTDAIPDYAARRRSYLDQCLAGADGHASDRLVQCMQDLTGRAAPAVSRSAERAVAT